MNRTLSDRWLPTAVLAALAVCAGCGDRVSDDTVTLEFWTLSLKPDFTQYIEGRIDAFEGEHPGVEVVWVDVPFGTVERKLIASAAAGRAPDVVNLSDLMFARFASAGAFLALDGVLEIDPGAVYQEDALRIGRLGDGLYALPWYLTTQTMIVNTEVLARGGLSLETVGRTWDELAAQAGAFRDATAGDATPAYLFTQPLGQDSQIPMMLLAEGMPPFREGEDGRLRADLTRDEVVGFVERWVGLYRMGAMPREAATNGFEHLIEVYQSERVAVLNTGANFLGRVRDTARGVYDATAVAEPLTGSLGRAHIAVMPLSVSASTDEPELAAALAVFMTSPESQLEFCRLATILPSTPETRGDAYFAGATAEEVARGDEMIGEARAIVARAIDEAAAFTPSIEAWPAMRRVFEERIKGTLLDGRDVRATLAEIEAEWDRQIDEMNARREVMGGRAATMDAVPMPERVDEPVGRVGRDGRVGAGS